MALVSSSSGSRGGGELYLVGLANGLAALGNEVLSVLSDHVRMDEVAALLGAFGPVHRIPYQNTYDRRLRCVGAVLARRDIARITGELAALDPDVIHVNKQNLEDGLDLLQAAQATGLPTVATIPYAPPATISVADMGGAAGGVRWTGFPDGFCAARHAHSSPSRSPA